MRATRNDLFPGPWQVVLGIVELVRKGLLLKYIVASLFRVTWGFGLAVLVGVPFGLFLGWFRHGLPGVQPADPGAPADLADRLDSAGDPLVRRLRRGPGVPDLPGQRLPDHRLGDGRRAEPPAGLPPGREELRPGPGPTVPPGDPAGDAPADPDRRADRARRRLAGRRRRRDDRGQLRPRLPDHRRPQRRQALRPGRRRHARHRPDRPGARPRSSGSWSDSRK